MTKHLKFLATPEKGEVSAILLVPENAKAIIVLGHGAGAGMQHASMESIATELANMGIGSFRYQFPFMERGGGRDSQKVSLATIVSAVQETKLHVPNLTLLAGGHSFGGRMTSLAAAQKMLDGVQGLLFFSFPLHAPGKPGIERAAHLQEIEQPMLFLSGTRDTLTKLELFEPVIANLGNKAKLHLLETANHGYKILKRTRKNPESVFKEIARVSDEWLERAVSC